MGTGEILMAGEVWVPATTLIIGGTVILGGPGIPGIERVDREEGYTAIIASASVRHIFHFAIPTPVIESDRPVRVDSVMLVFTTNLDGGSLGTRILRGEVRDGTTLLHEQPLDVTGGPEALQKLDVFNASPLRRGINISVLVEFARRGAAIRFHAAGASFGAL